MMKFFSIEQLIKMDDIDNSTMDKLFFLSLFEISHFEQKGFMYTSGEIKFEIRKILKKFGRNFLRRNEIYINSIIESQFFTGKICNLLISYKLSKKFNKKVRTTHMNNHEIDVYIGFMKLNLEIKRCAFTGNIANYIDEEIEKIPFLEQSRVKNILIFFVFFCEMKEESDFIKRWAIDGYRNLFGYMQEKDIIPKNFHFLIDTFLRGSKLDDLIDNLYLYIDKIKLSG